MLAGYIPAFVVAFALDVVLVGPLAKKFAFALLHKLGHQDKRWIKILTISGTMDLGMVTLMSLYGLIFNVGLSGLSWVTYGQAWSTNVIVALPLNFLLAGPISRSTLGSIQKPLPDETEVKGFDDNEEELTII